MTTSPKLESNPEHTASVSRSWQSVQIVFNIINHILIAIVVTYMSSLCYRMGNMPISWHVWLCTVGVSNLNVKLQIANISICNSSSSKYSVSTADDWSHFDILCTKRMVEAILESNETDNSLDTTSTWLFNSLSRGGFLFHYPKSRFKSTFHEYTFDFWSCRWPLHIDQSLQRDISTVFGWTEKFRQASSFETSPSVQWNCYVFIRYYLSTVQFSLKKNMMQSSICISGMITLALGYDRCYMRHHSREDIRMWLQAFAIITVLLSLFGAVRASLNYIRNILTK